MNERRICQHRTSSAEVVGEHGHLGALFVTGHAISITYSECVCVALGVQIAMRTCHVVVSPVACPGTTIFFLIVSYRERFLEKGIIEILNVLFDFLYTVWLTHL
jgi:hypothetical protein